MGLRIAILEDDPDQLALLALAGRRRSDVHTFSNGRDDARCAGRNFDLRP
jgi:hypothetical protein